MQLQTCGSSCSNGRNGNSLGRIGSTTCNESSVNVGNSSSAALFLSTGAISPSGSCLQPLPASLNSISSRSSSTSGDEVSSVSCSQGHNQQFSSHIYGPGNSFLQQLSQPGSTNHCQIGPGVLDHFTSGLALQATLEAPELFLPRLEAELRRWRDFAPSLVQLDSSSNLSEQPTDDIYPVGGGAGQLDAVPSGSGAASKACGSATSGPTSIPISHNNPTFRWECCSLIVNVDTRTVEVSSSS
ncbi:unnamed protein product [Protopolystoma xenopodis]|uniref:Uncharacterized protein n=1 Tax=Protopolystoma xenopodis TaxID=117903 RepID=A0A3S5AQZ9_9PLAT|nr:unnamed protein product [Protopolystoma xenopodis]